MSERRFDFISSPSKALTGRITVPGDKSISHRAVMLGAIAQGDTHIHGFLDSADTRATLKAFEQMGVTADRAGDNEIIIHGAGLGGLKAPGRTLDLGNSGTSVRLLAGLLAGQAFDSELRGDASLMKRPMGRIVDPLRRMGADISCTPEGTLPVVIHGGKELIGISYTLPVASAQLKSSLLLAGLYARGTTTIIEPVVTRDHTERMLRHFGCPVERTDNRICINRHGLQGREVRVPGDISSATFFMVAAAVIPGSELVIEGVGINPTRHAVIEILGRMGAAIRIEKTDTLNEEPVADIHVKYHPLHGIHVPVDLVPIAIDEFPAIFIAAACADGETVLTEAAELRVKESDRITAMAEGLSMLGISAVPLEDGMRIQGGRLRGGEVNSYTDHRIAMAFAVAGAAARGPVRIRDCINVDTSFPGFVNTANQTGMAVSTEVRYG